MFLDTGLHHSFSSNVNPPQKTLSRPLLLILTPLSFYHVDVVLDPPLRRSAWDQLSTNRLRRNIHVPVAHCVPHHPLSLSVSLSISLSLSVSLNPTGRGRWPPTIEPGSAPRFLPIKRQFFLATVAECLLMGEMLGLCK